MSSHNTLEVLMRIRSRPLLFILFLSFLFIPTFSLLARDFNLVENDYFKPVNKILLEAEAKKAELLSPNNYKKGIEYYQEATIVYRKRGITGKVKTSLARSKENLTLSIEASKIAANNVGNLLEIRQLIISKKLYENAQEKFKKADNLLFQILEKIEQGNLRGAKARVKKAETAYYETAFTAYQKGKLPKVRQNLKSKRKELGKSRYKASNYNIDVFEDWLKNQKKSQMSVADFVYSAENRIKDIVGFLTPAWYKNMPDTLIFGDFTLYVENYETKGNYNLSSNTSIGASGTAKIRFNCGYFFLHPFFAGNLQLITETFTVVETVEDPETEISLIEAIQFNPELKIGKKIALDLPKKTVESIGIHSAKQELLGSIQLKPTIPGIRVKFTDATIEPGERFTIGTMLAGLATYPTTKPDPIPPAKLFIEGFKVEMDSLVITVSGAVANMKLRLPSTILDNPGCEAALIDLGSLAITQDCQFYKEMPDQTFGVWIIDPTGMKIEGNGLIADFNKLYSPPGYGLDPDWKGLILANGETIPAASGSLHSNSGYLQAHYSFNDALITSSGLEGEFILNSGYSFHTLVPYDYSLFLSAAYIQMDSSNVASGKITSGQITIPELAVCRGTPGTKLMAYVNDLEIQSDLDLAGKVNMTQDLYWGEISGAGEKEVFFQGSPDTSSDGYAWFYLNGKGSQRYLPTTDADFNNIHLWGNIAMFLENYQLQGLTIRRLEKLTIYSPDISGSDKKIEFKDGVNCNFNNCWLNIETLGLSGEINFGVDTRTELLGDINFDYYVGGNPFETILECIVQKERCFFLRFSSSALYDSEFNGQLSLKGACNTKIPFVDLEFTSTAHIVGGDIDLSAGPVTLDHWKLDLVETSPGDPAGALSIKTGQIILTQAGLAEPRHFNKPFHLIWGELLANGNVGELFFDYNSADQKFDGFIFTPHHVSLSEYIPADNGYLQVCGDNHFDFFGSSYLSIQDSVFTGDDPLSLFDGRRIGIIKESIEYCSASDLNITKNWGNSSSYLDFNIIYDDNDQDGFLGEGNVSMPEQFYNAVPASIQLDSEDIEIGLIGSSGENFMLHAVDLGSASEMWGCMNIEDNTMECITLGFTLEAYADSPFGLLGSAQTMIEAKMSIKPTVTTFVAAGSMFLDMSLGGNVQINGSITLIANRSEASIFGDFQGEFDFGNICSGFEADGHLNWYLSPMTQYVQGRGGIEIYGKAIGKGGLSGGVFIGNNVPKEDIWVLTDTSNKYAVNMSSFPSYVTGVYGFGQVSFSMDFGVFGGGLEIYAGVGAFMNLPGLTDNITGLPLPYVLANIGVSLHGEILWGAVSASAWVNLQIMLGDPFYFQGSAGLEGCVLWVMCASVDVTVRLDENGFDIY